MADFIKKFRTNQGDKRLDYNALGNLPTIDSELDENSKNAVQNNVVATAVKELSNKIEENPPGGDAPQITIDSELSENSENPVQNKVIVEALKNYATNDSVDEKIGDVETALENIIDKYNLGGEVV